MTLPLVSVLTTCYNREKYISDCIESVLTSTYQNWELIIVDDKSTDQSVAIAKQYAEKDKRISVYVNESNLGDYPNRNKAASYATGTYLKYLDADDIIYPNSLQIMVDSMEKHPDAALGISGKNLNDIKPYPIQYQPTDIYEKHFLNRGLVWVGPSSTIIKRTIFNELNGFSGKRFVGDTEFWLKVCASHPLLKIQSGLVYVRKHKRQEYSKGHLNFDYTVLNYKVAINALQSEQCPLDNKKREAALQWISYRHKRDILNIMVKQKRVKRGLEIMKESDLSLIQLLHSILKFK